MDGTCVHVDHVTAFGVTMRTGFYGPYCNRACWELDAQPADKFEDAGRFGFDVRPIDNPRPSGQRIAWAVEVTAGPSHRACSSPSW
jgi:hypothetical protein